MLTDEAVIVSWTAVLPRDARPFCIISSSRRSTVPEMAEGGLAAGIYLSHWQAIALGASVAAVDMDLRFPGFSLRQARTLSVHPTDNVSACEHPALQLRDSWQCLSSGKEEGAHTCQGRA